MRVALVSVYSHDQCTLKDVAGGFGTVFRIGDSVLARTLERAKGRIVRMAPVTLAHLAALAREAGHDPVVVEVQRGAARANRAPPAIDAELALVLTSIVDAPAEREVLRELRDAGVRTIAFGAYATARPSEFADVATTVVRGEPEALGAELFECAPGIVDAGFVQDLDVLPLPDWSPFPFHDYRYAFLSRGPTLPIAGARGCAYGCSYCPFRVTAPFRERDPERIGAELRAHVERYGVRAFAFRDPLFNLDSARVRRLASVLRELDIRFSAEMRADRLDEDLLRVLHRAGLRSLEMGIESVDRDMLARERRQPPTLARIERVVGAAHDLGIRVIANFMMGLPDDDEAKIRASVAYAKRLNTFAVQFTVATPYPGTGLEARVRPLLRAAPPSAYTGWEPLFDHPALSAERLRMLREWAYVTYHFRPRYAARFAVHALDAMLDPVWRASTERGRAQARHLA